MANVAFLNDTFTDADLTLLQNHTGQLGATWTQRNGLVSNSLLIHPSGQVIIGTPQAGVANAYTASGSGGNDTVITATCKRISTRQFPEARLLNRWTSGNKYYYTTCDSSLSQFYILYFDGANDHVLASSAVTQVGTGSNYTLQIACIQGRITAIYNGVTSITATDSNLTSGPAGLSIYSDIAGTLTDGESFINISGIIPPLRQINLEAQMQALAGGIRG